LSLALESLTCVLMSDANSLPSCIRSAYEPISAEATNASHRKSK
jgi:hypothetical protein